MEHKAYSEQHFERIMGLKGQIENYGVERARLTSSEHLSPTGKAEAVAPLRAKIDATIADTYDGVAATWDKDIKAAQARATRKLAKIDPTVKTYSAVVAEQDIKSRTGRPKDLMAMYEEASKAEDIARRADLKRLLDPMLSTDDATKYDWAETLKANRTPDEAEADHITAAWDMYQSHVNGIKDSTNQLLKQVDSGRDTWTVLQQSGHDKVMNAYADSVAKAAFKGGPYDASFDPDPPRSPEAQASFDRQRAINAREYLASIPH